MKDVSDQQVAEHLKQLNPWWLSGQMDSVTLGLRPRAYLGLVQRLLADPILRRAIVLLGPRRVGKRYQRERSFKVYLTNPAMYTGLFGVPNAENSDFGHLVETAVFAQRFHEDARLNYAKWGADDTEVDLVESSQTLKPVSALEIKWSDRHVDRPEELKGLWRFARRHHLPLAWGTTRTRFAEFVEADGPTIRLWPAAALAFHYGVRALKGRTADYETRIRNNTTR